MEVCLPDIRPGNLSLQCIFPSSQWSLLSNPYHTTGSYLLHTCPHFLLNKMFPLFALDVIDPGHWEVAYACMPCSYGPHKSLLPRPWLSNLQRFLHAPFPACLNLDASRCRFWVPGVSVLKSFPCPWHQLSISRSCRMLLLQYRAALFRLRGRPSHHCK